MPEQHHVTVDGTTGDTWGLDSDYDPVTDSFLVYVTRNGNRVGDPVVHYGFMDWMAIDSVVVVP